MEWSQLKTCPVESINILSIASALILAYIMLENTNNDKVYVIKPQNIKQ